MHFNKVSMATWPLLQVAEDAQLEGLVTSAYTYHPNTRIQTYFRDELIPFSHPDV